jgi:drug/metabolite transporter (DMT)-like permease
MSDRIKNPARDRMEDRTLFILMPLLVVNLGLVFWGFGYRHMHPSGIWAYIFAMAFALLGVAFIVIFGLYLKEEQDEFERAVWVQSLLWGIGATLTVVTLWGSFAEYALVKGLKMLFVFPLFMLITVVARLALKLRYR